MQPKETAKQAKERAERVAREVREKVAGYLLTAFGLVAGLAWNDAIKQMIELLYPLENNSLMAKFIYALIITTLVVIVSIVIVKYGKSKEKEEVK